MGSRNNTNVPDFIFMGLTDSEKIQRLLFMLFLLIYLITVLGNAGMILIIHLDLQLHTLKYFFLSHLSLLDLSYSMAITTKTLENVLTSNKSISFMGCFIQMFFVFFFLAITECFLLSSMAYDCYVAMCNPVHYPVVMSTRLCQALITWPYMIGFTESLVNVLYINSLHFCKSKVISHFFCDLIPLLTLSCTNTHDTEIMIFTLSSLNIKVSLILISVSYVSILSTILKINSSSGKRKAFSTCISHLLGVTIFYSTMIYTYLKPKRSYPLGKDQVASVFYPMEVLILNPFIYNLRNKEVENALIRVMQKRKGSRQLK